MAANAKSIESGSAFVRLFSDKSQLVRGLGSARKDFDNWAQGMRSAGLKLAAVGGAGFAAGAFAVKQFSDVGSALNDMSARTGVSVEALSKLKYAAEQNGSSLEALEGGLKKYQKSIVAARGGSKEAIASFAALGLRISDLNGLSDDQAIALIGQRLQKLPAGARRAAAAMGVFGKSGADLIPILGNLQADMDRASKLGLGWTTEEASNADALGDRLDDLSSVLMRTVQIVGGELAPVVMQLTEPLLEAAVATREWAAENPGVIQTVALATTAIGGLGVVLLSTGVALSATGMAMGGFATTLTGIGGVIGGVAGPLSLLNAGTKALGGAASTALGSYSKLASGITSVVTASVSGVSSLGSGVASLAESAIPQSTAISTPVTSVRDTRSEAATNSAVQQKAADTKRIARESEEKKQRRESAIESLQARKKNDMLAGRKSAAASAPTFFVRTPLAKAGADGASKTAGILAEARRQAGAKMMADRTARIIATARQQGRFKKAPSAKTMGILSLARSQGAAKAGIGSRIGKAGIAATKTALGGLQVIVSPLTSSFGVLTKTISKGFGGATKSVLTFSGSLATAMAPLLAIGAIAGIGYLIATETDIGRNAVAKLKDGAEIAMASVGIAGDQMAARMSEAWSVISTEAIDGSDQAVTAWDGITDAVAAGDLSLAGEVAMAGLNAAWRTGAATIIDTWTVGVSMIESTWSDATHGMMSVGENLTAWFSTIWLDIKGFAFDAFDAMASKWDSVSGGIADVLIDLGVQSGAIQGNADEIKQTRREDTQRRQTGRDAGVGGRADERATQQAEIEANRQVGQAGIEAARAAEQKKIGEQRDKDLLANEQAKKDAQEKLAVLRGKAAKAAQDKADKDKSPKPDDHPVDDPIDDPSNNSGAGGSGFGGASSGLVATLNRGGSGGGPNAKIKDTTQAVTEQKSAYNELTKAINEAAAAAVNAAALAGKSPEEQAAAGKAAADAVQAKQGQAPAVNRGPVVAVVADDGQPVAPVKMPKTSAKYTGTPRTFTDDELKTGGIGQKKPAAPLTDEEMRKKGINQGTVSGALSDAELKKKGIGQATPQTAFTPDELKKKGIGPTSPVRPLPLPNFGNIRPPSVDLPTSPNRFSTATTQASDPADTALLSGILDTLRKLDSRVATGGTFTA